MEHTLIQKLSQLMQENQDVALVTVTDTEGSSPRGKGSMMLVDKEGNLIEGTIGGGAVEEKAKQDAAICIRRGISKAVHYALHPKAKENALPMICGGNMDVFIKVFTRQDSLLIIGGGHIGTKLSKIAKILNYHVTVIDHRKEFASKERFPEADECLVGDIEDILVKYPIDEKTNIVIVTHGHRYDQEALEAVINSPAGYIGMIGSQKKVLTCFNNLEEKGISKNRIAAIHAPIGLDIGGEKPEEIALAIMSEIQSVKYNKSGSYLKIGNSESSGA
ncbi:XdhC/CoxI family protein [Clostridiaceae bacterium 35-E11]